MKTLNHSGGWLALTALVLLTPVLSVAQQSYARKACDFRAGERCRQQVPESGPAPAYLLVAAISCAGAMLVRTRLQNSR